jgi:hypothetical protein
MIEAIAITIAVVGAALLLILFARIRAVDAELQLKKHRAKDAGLADLLNYAAVVDDGVIVGKNGSFMAAWLYAGMTTPAAPTSSAKWCRSASTRPLRGWATAGWCMSMRCAGRRPTTRMRGVSRFPDCRLGRDRRGTAALFEGLGTMYEGYFVLTRHLVPAQCWRNASSLN